MNYKSYKKLMSEIADIKNEKKIIESTSNGLSSLIEIGTINPDEATNQIFQELDDSLLALKYALYDLEVVSSNYSFLKKHERIADSNKWLNYNIVTHISKSYACKCGNNAHTNKHVCATELVSGDEGWNEGAFFLEKMKCSSCDETFIIENGV